MVRISRNIQKLGLIMLAAVIGVQPLAAAENKHDNDTLKAVRDTCMEEVGVQPFCACAEKAVKDHIPSGALHLNEHSSLEMDAETPDEVYDAVNADVAECGKKFAPDKWQG